MAGFIPYKNKKARTSPERKPIFKEPLPVLEMLAQLVHKGKITEIQASEALLVKSPEDFHAYAIKYHLLGW